MAKYYFLLGNALMTGFENHFNPELTIFANPKTMDRHVQPVSGELISNPTINGVVCSE